MKKYILLVIMLMATASWGQFTTPSGGAGSSDSIGVDADGDGTIDNYIFPSHFKKGTNITLTVTGDTVTIAGPASSGTADSIGIDTDGDEAVDGYIYSTVAGAMAIFKGANIIFTLVDDTLTVAVPTGSTSQLGVLQASSDNFAASSGIFTVKTGGIDGTEMLDSTVELIDIKAVTPPADSNIAIANLADNSMAWTPFTNLYSFYYANDFYDFKVDELNDTMIDFGTGTNEVSATDLPDFGTMTIGNGRILVSNNTEFNSVEMSDDGSISTAGVLTIDSAWYAKDLTDAQDSLYIDTTEAPKIYGTGTVGYIMYFGGVDGGGNDSIYYGALSGSGDNAYADTGTALADLGSPFVIQEGTGCNLVVDNDTLEIMTTLGVSIDLSTEVTGTLADGYVSNDITVNGYMQDGDVNTFAELQSWVYDKTLVNEEDAFTLDGNWVNTAYPWADDEIANNISYTFYIDTTGNTTPDRTFSKRITIMEGSYIDFHYINDSTFSVEGSAGGTGGDDAWADTGDGVVDMGSPFYMTEGDGINIKIDSDSAIFEATLGISIVASEMADGDHGDFTYSTGTADLDIGVIDSPQVTQNAIKGWHIATSTIENSDIVDSTITGADIGTGVIHPPHIGTGTFAFNDSITADTGIFIHAYKGSVATANEFTTQGNMESLIEDSLNEYSITSDVRSIVGDSLGEYSTTSEVRDIIGDSLGEYSTTSEMQLEIEDSLDEYSTTTDIRSIVGDSLDEYSTTVEIRDIVGDSLGEYATSSEMQLVVEDSLNEYALITAVPSLETDAAHDNFSELAGTVGDAQIAAAAVDGGTTGEIADQTITKADIDTTGSNFVFDDAYNYTSAVGDSMLPTKKYVQVMIEDSLNEYAVLASPNFTGKLTADSAQFDGNVNIDSIDVNGAANFSGNITVNGKTLTGNHHWTFNIFNPNAAYLADSVICITPKTEAALTITEITVTCNYNPTTEPDFDLYYADTFIGMSGETLLQALNTPDGDTTITGLTAATPTGKAVYLKWGAEPIDAITQIAVTITWDFD